MIRFGCLAMHKVLFQTRAIFNGTQDASLKAIYFAFPARFPAIPVNGELKELDFTAVNSDCGQNHRQRRYGHMDLSTVGSGSHLG